MYYLCHCPPFLTTLEAVDYSVLVYYPYQELTLCHCVPQSKKCQSAPGECAKASTISSRRIENLIIRSVNNMNLKVLQKLKGLHAKT